MSRTDELWCLTPDIVETRKFNVKMTSVCVLTIWVVCALTALRDAVARVLKDVPRGTSFGCARFLRRARSARIAAASGPEVTVRRKKRGPSVGYSWHARKTRQLCVGPSAGCTLSHQHDGK